MESDSPRNVCKCCLADSNGGRGSGIESQWGYAALLNNYHAANPLSDQRHWVILEAISDVQDAQSSIRRARNWAHQKLLEPE